jgi:hypothetical protein
MDMSFNDIWRFWHDFTQWNPPEVVMFTMVGLGFLSSWMMSQKTAAPPMIFGPIAFIVLTFSAMLVNYGARGIIMMGTSEMQRTLFLTLLGHTVAALLLLSFFKIGEKNANR